MSHTLADVVQVAPRFARSIRVEGDLLSSAALEGFVCSASVTTVLQGIARQYAGAGQRAFTITGTYGAGKSSLAVALACLVGRVPTVSTGARTILGEELADEVTTALGVREGYQVVSLVGYRADPTDAIGAALDASISNGRRRRGKGRPTTLATRLLEAASAPGSDGLLLVIDEMGKLLEAAASGDGDVHVFQEMAEAAARSGGRLLVIGLLHSSFEEYAGRLGASARREWAKVQGRFVDLPLSIGLEEQVDILSRAVVSDRRPSSNYERALTVASEVCRARPEAIVGLASRLDACWPLEPLAAIGLSALARRGFGQAQRSLFAFLTSAEPRGFRDVLSTLPENVERGYLAANLWDYIAANRGLASLGTSEGQRLALALDALDRCAARGGGADHEVVLKTVALLDLLRETASCHATRSVLAASLPDGVASKLDGLLADLLAWSVLVHRRHLNAYALFAGSDIDVGKLVASAISRLSGVDVTRLNALAALPPVVAKRHHEEFGALRWFPVEIVALADAKAHMAAIKPASDGAAGTFLLALPLSGESNAKARSAWKKAAAQPVAAPIALGLARNGFRVREAAQEILALELVRRETPELQSDAVARREVYGRMEAAVAELETVLRDALASADWVAAVPGIEEPLPLPDGSSAALTAAASQLADLTFHKSPKLRSDLLNRSEPSTNAVAARRALLHSMVERSDTAALGMSGFPPQRGLYISLLERTGLHRPVDEGGTRWAFMEPESDGSEYGLSALWEAADQMLNREDSSTASVARLYELWRVRPFGVRAGLLPVLATAYLLSRRDRVAVALDGTFAPTLTSFLVDRMLQEPDAVELRWSEDSGARNAWLLAVSDALVEAGIPILAEDHSRPPQPLDVARTIFAFVAALPAWTMRTTRLAPRAQKLKIAVRKARDPLALLLDEMPPILGGALSSPEEARMLASTLAAELKKLGNAFPALLNEISGTIRHEFRLDAEGGLDALPARARAVKGSSGDLRLDALAVYLEAYEDRPEQAEAIAALAVHKPARDWTDRDVDAAKLTISELAQRFMRAEALAHVKGRSGTAEVIGIVTSAPGRPAPLVTEVRLSRAAETRVAPLLAGIENLLASNGAEDEVQVAALIRALATRITRDTDATPKAKRRVR